METAIKVNDKTTVVTLKGRLDSVTSADFDKAVESLWAGEPTPEILIDCKELEYVSSAGLRSLITILKKSKASGRELRISNLSPSIKSIFDMTGFTNIFKII
ncbi:MAG: STAS domain-containing protein [Muribaculaceae bacterium]|nr:STAS domain-containing protein [Muribaculaceae bacterium]